MREILIEPVVWLPLLWCIKLYTVYPEDVKHAIDIIDERCIIFNTAIQRSLATRYIQRQDIIPEGPGISCLMYLHAI